MPENIGFGRKSKQGLLVLAVNMLAADTTSLHRRAEDT
jgi:hypothetical protein